ncbi:hypothetical protein [Sorangium sp. So ce1153]|uniref:hypothetical protein n=1 Tax=Sorangium sp. So ce1153 TaxID=3133333 RepID=UPI003F5F54BE
MNPEALRANLRDRSALSDAQRALILLDVRVQENFFGTIEGVDTIDLALDALAYPLARLLSFPLDATEAPSIDDVLNYLASRDLIEPDTVELLERVREGIKKSTYAGLRHRGVIDLEAARGKLYEHLEALLCLAEEALDG